MTEHQDIGARLLGWADRLANLLAVIGGFAVIALVIVTVVAVVWRYVLNDPIFGIDDVSTMMLIVAVAGAMAYGGRTGAHVKVDIISNVVGRKVTRFTDIIVRVGGFVIIALTTYALVESAMCGYACGNFTPNLTISHFPFYILLAIAMGVYAIILILELISGLAHFSDARDPNERE